MRHMTAARALACTVIACLCLCPFSAQAEQYDLNKFDAGSYVTGPKASGKDLRGKVVVIKYWGHACPPCIDAIPHTTDLAKEYGHDKLVIIANQSWSASDERSKEVWKKHAKNNMVMVVNRGKFKNFKPKSVPWVLIFDHTGKSVWQGYPGTMDRPLAEAIANLPEPAEGDDAPLLHEEESAGPALIVRGLEEPEFFKSEVRLINAQDRNITSTLAKLRRASKRSSKQEQMDEAKLIVTAVEAWAEQQQAKADAALAKDPATAYTTAQTLVGLLERDELAQDAAGIVEQIEKDTELHSRVQATIALRSVIAEAESIGLTSDASVADDRKHARSIRLITRDLGRIIQAYPDTDAGKRAKALLSEWGLEDK